MSNKGSGSPVHYGDLLVKTRERLEEKGYQFTRYVKDQYGIYAGIFVAVGEPIPFALVCKAGYALKGSIVSTQKDLLLDWKSALVLAWQKEKDEEMEFYVFNPEEIIYEWRVTKNAFENEMRAGCKMINFSVTLGTSWLPLHETLIFAWRKRKENFKPNKDLMAYFPEFED
jgi:hypothetical protein